jgi:predicted dithiol-disulfide oxidoreductase (DUF899 family)
MFGPDWTEGCAICSFWADAYDAMRPHLAARSVALACVSRAPLATLDAFRKRMGWRIPWYSSAGSIQLTYACYSRGLDDLNPVYQMLDLVPLGRDEANLPWPMAWVRHHDRYRD